MKKGRKLSVALATMLIIQTIIVTGCTDDSTSVDKIETEITTESITQEETIQTESEKNQDNKGINTQVELLNIVQIINEEDYKPFDITLDEFIDNYNYFAKQEVPHYESVLIEDEDIIFYDTSQTGNCNVYVIPIGDRVTILDLIVYCSSEDKNKILNIKYFTRPIEEANYGENKLYAETIAGAMLSIICSINRDICFDSTDGALDVTNYLVKEMNGEFSKGIMEYREYIYTLIQDWEKIRIEFDLIKG